MGIHGNSELNPVFTPEEVESLNAYQQTRAFHPFTCGSGRRTDEHHLDGEGILVATAQGWICPYCGYTQNWAHPWMKDGSWKKSVTARMAFQVMSAAKPEEELMPHTHAEGASCEVCGADTAVYLHSRCHVASPTWARLERDTITIECAECKKVVGVFPIANRWKPISDANLPKAAYEVFGHDKERGPYVEHVTEEEEDYTAEQWLEYGYTHTRPIDIPDPL